jgi:hypothetical protein
MSKPVTSDILSVLEPWLTERIEEWGRRSGPVREPTLPVHKGKVNVRGIATAIGLPASQVQHLFRQPVLRTAINVVAEEQGLMPIGAFAADEPASEVEKALAGRLRQSQTRSNDLGKVVAEQAGIIERQRAEIAGLRAQLRMLEDMGQVLRTGQVR